MDSPVSPDAQHQDLAGLVNSLDDDGFVALSRAVGERKCREMIGFGTFAEACAAYSPGEPTCPKCGGEHTVRNGYNRIGVRRYKCRVCDKSFTALTGTAVEGMRCDFPTFVEFVTLMRYNSTLNAIAETCGITHQLAWEWRHRVFASVRGYQDGIVLRDKVWIDETFIDDTELYPKLGGRRKQGLSKEKVCICVAIDSHKNIVAKRAGNGKPSGDRVYKALGGNIEAGSTIVDDKDRSHNLLARKVGGERMSFKANSKDPVYLENLAPVNNLCSWIKRYLWRFPGMEMKYLQGYLDWYVYLFRVNQAKAKWPQTQRIIRHLLLTRVETIV